MPLVFLKKVFLFLLPILLAIVLITLLYTKTGGDLNRLGKIPFPKDYRDQFKADFNQAMLFQNMSEIDLENCDQYDILTIGDSFSNLGGVSYQNYMIKNLNLKVLNFDDDAFYISKDYNPIEFLYNILSSDLLNNIKPKVVILEMVERNFLNHMFNIEKQRIYNSKELNNLKRNLKKTKPKTTIKSIFNDAMLFFRYGIFYQFNDHAFQSPVYVMEMNKVLFTAHGNQLMFFDGDVFWVHRITPENISKVNIILNQLALELKKKNIKLIVLPAADKYDVYGDFIVNNRHIKNRFFELMNQQAKDYLFIDTKATFRPYLEDGLLDLYFADDTHWSPKGAKIIANEINSLILKNEIY